MDPIGEGLKVLIVDDEAGIRRGFNFLCMRLGFEVVQAENVEHAWEQMAANEGPGSFDLVLSDNRMYPGKTGEVFTRELVQFFVDRGEMDECPRFMLISADDKEHFTPWLIGMKDLGAKALFFSKVSFDSMALISAIKQLLSS